MSEKENLENDNNKLLSENLYEIFNPNEDKTHLQNISNEFKFLWNYTFK